MTKFGLLRIQVNLELKSFPNIESTQQSVDFPGAKLPPCSVTEFPKAVLIQFHNQFF